jgi:AcrR family transcriptional regulator
VPASVVQRLDPVVLAVFSRGDFHRVDMRTIARQAGMSFSTIYRHFKDKESLLFWFIAHWLQVLERDAVAALDARGGTLMKLKNYLVAHFSFYEQHPDVGRIIFMTVPLERWMRDPTYQYKLPARRLLEVITDGQKTGSIRPDVAPSMVMDLMFGLFNRTFLMWEHRGRVDSLVAKAEACIDMVFEGIHPRKPPFHRKPAAASV